MSDPTRMGIGVPTGSALGRRQRHCPGAMLRVTRDDYLASRREGQLFATGEKDIRHEGYSDARTHCTRDVAEISVREYAREPGQNGEPDRKVVTSIYDAALCSSCADLERGNRADLAQRFAARPK